MLFLLIKIAVFFPGIAGFSFVHQHGLVPRRITDTSSLLPAVASSLVVHSTGTYGLHVDAGSTSTNLDFLLDNTHAYNTEFAHDTTDDPGPVCVAVPNFCAAFEWAKHSIHALYVSTLDTSLAYLPQNFLEYNASFSTDTTTRFQDLARQLLGAVPVNPVTRNLYADVTTRYDGPLYEDLASFQYNTT